MMQVAELELQRLRDEIDHLEEMLLARVKKYGLRFPFLMRITLENPDGNNVVALGSWKEDD